MHYDALPFSAGRCFSLLFGIGGCCSVLLCAVQCCSVVQCGTALFYLLPYCLVLLSVVMCSSFWQRDGEARGSARVFFLTLSFPFVGMRFLTRQTDAIATAKDSLMEEAHVAVYQYKMRQRARVNIGAIGSHCLIRNAYATVRDCFM